MTGLTFVWLGVATTLFVAAHAVSKTYAMKGGLPVPIGALGCVAVAMIAWPTGAKG